MWEGLYAPAARAADIPSGRKAPPTLEISIQRLAVPAHADGHRDHEEERERPELRQDFHDAVTLEQDAADDAQEMRVGQAAADPLRPDRHAAERKHETG